MSDESSRVRIRKRQMIAYRGRGAIYNWLRAHRAKVAEFLDGDKATWPDLCAEMVRHGVSDRGGDGPASKAAAKVWKRVCRDAGDEPPPVYRFKNYPSRISKDWRPSGFREEQPSRPALPSPDSDSNVPADYREPPLDPDMTIQEKLGTTPDLIRTPVSEDRKRYVKERIAAARRDIQGR